MTPEELKAIKATLEKIGEAGTDSMKLAAALDKFDHTSVENMVALVREVERLRAIVERLKKTDNGVPLCPGDTCYVVATDHWCEPNEEEFRVIRCIYYDPDAEQGSQWVYTADDPNNDWDEFDVYGVYSTWEAAEAAAKEKP